MGKVPSAIPAYAAKTFVSSIVQCYSKSREDIKAWLEWRLHRFSESARVPDFCASASRASNVLLIIGRSGCGKRSLVRDVVEELNFQSKPGRVGTSSDEPEYRIEVVDDHAVDSVQGLLRITEEAVCLNRLQCFAGVQQLPVWLFPGFDGFSMTEKIDRPRPEDADSPPGSKFVPASAAVSRLLGIWGVTQAWDSKRHVHIPPVILTVQSILEAEKMGLTSANIARVYMGAFRTAGAVHFAKSALRKWVPMTKVGAVTQNALVERFDGDFRRTVDELTLARDNETRASKHPHVDGSCTVKIVPSSRLFLSTVARGLYQHLSAFVFQEAKKIQLVWVKDEEASPRQRRHQEQLVYITNFSYLSVSKACYLVRAELGRLRVATMKSVLADYLNTLLSAYMDAASMRPLETYCIAAVGSGMGGLSTDHVAPAVTSPSPCTRDDAELHAVIGLVRKHFAILRSMPSADEAMDFCRRNISKELAGVLRRYTFEETLSVYTALQACEPKSSALRGPGGKCPCPFLSFSGMHVDDLEHVWTVVEGHRLLPAADPRVALDMSRLIALEGTGAQFSLCPDVLAYRLVVDTRTLQQVEADRDGGRVAVKLLRGNMERTVSDSRSSDVFFNSASDAVTAILHLHTKAQTSEEAVPGYAPPERPVESLLLPGKFLADSKRFVFHDGGVIKQGCKNAHGKLSLVTPMAMTKKRKEGVCSILARQAADQQVRLDAMAAFPGAEAMLWLYSYSGWHAQASAKGKAFPTSVVSIADAWSTHSSCDFKKAVAAKDILNWLIVHRVRLERATEDTLNVVWPKAPEPELSAAAPRHPPKKRQCVEAAPIPEKPDPAWGWGKQRPDMSRGTLLGGSDDRSSTSMVHMYQQLRRLRLGCIETATQKSLVVADALNLMRLKTQREGVKPRVTQVAMLMASAAETSACGQDVPDAVEANMCVFCRVPKKDATPAELDGMGQCGGLCTFRAPRLTDVKAAKEDKEGAFELYAVRGFRRDLLPPMLQEDKSNQEFNEAKRKVDEARRQLAPLLAEYTESMLSSWPDTSLSAFKGLYWCRGAARCSATCWCSLPAELTKLVEFNPGVKFVLESVAMVELDTLFFEWRAMHARPAEELAALRPCVQAVVERAPVLGAITMAAEEEDEWTCADGKVTEAGPGARVGHKEKDAHGTEAGPGARVGNEEKDAHGTEAGPDARVGREEKDTQVTEVPGQYKQWTRNGKLHRDNDLPARIEYTSRGTTLSYLFDGLPFRSVQNLPHVWHQLKHIRCSCEAVATICTCESQVAGDQYVWLDASGRPHREKDQPAVVGPGRFKQWYQHGILHREVGRGPAQITENGVASFYSQGVHQHV